MVWECHIPASWSILHIYFPTLYKRVRFTLAYSCRHFGGTFRKLSFSPPKISKAFLLDSYWITFDWWIHFWHMTQHSRWRSELQQRIFQDGARVRGWGVLATVLVEQTGSYSKQAWERAALWVNVSQGQIIVPNVTQRDAEPRLQISRFCRSHFFVAMVWGEESTFILPFYFMPESLWYYLLAGCLLLDTYTHVWLLKQSLQQRLNGRWMKQAIERGERRKKKSQAGVLVPLRQGLLPFW